MSTVQGIQGYHKNPTAFARVTEAIPFEQLHQDFLPFLPKKTSFVLDLGAGSGRDAFELSRRNHRVVALEPLDSFRALGRKWYPSNRIHWVNDSLPELRKLNAFTESFDFALSSGVWHHLPPAEQMLAIQQCTSLLKPGAFLALSLRNGPAGVGTYTFPVHIDQIKQQTKASGLKVCLALENQPSLLPNKSSVYWSRLVLQKVIVQPAVSIGPGIYAHNHDGSQNNE